MLGFKKPKQEAYQISCSRMGVQPESTLFIDDSMQHILGARQAGLHATHLSNEKSIFHTVSFIENVNNSQLKEEKSDLNLARSNCKVLAS